MNAVIARVSARCATPLSVARRWGRRLARKGAILPLVAVFIVVLMVLAMIMVDVSYMQLINTELRAATDSAAKAGVEALSREQDTTAAIDAAVDYASRNVVAGRSVILDRSDVLIGTARRQTGGAWGFTQGGGRPNAVRVRSRLADNNLNGGVPLFLSGFFGHGNYEPEREATAASLELEICLTIDRSHSMCFDLSGVEWVYPPAVPPTPHQICYPPDPLDSRWKFLRIALDEFLSTCEASYQVPRIALVTWGSDEPVGGIPHKWTGQTEVAVCRETALDTDYTGIRQAIDARSNKIMLGATHMSAGMNEAIDLLTGPTTRPFTHKVMILMTDGVWNVGTNPTVCAQNAANKGIVIHTVTFLSKADQTTMKSVASITGGQHFHADDGSQLEEAFAALARTLPVVLTE